MRRSRANLIAALTSVALRQLAITAGRRSMAAFSTLRASSYSASAGPITGPSIAPRRRSISSCTMPPTRTSSRLQARLEAHNHTQASRYGLGLRWRGKGVDARVTARLGCVFEGFDEFD